jgi:hypothetical protein
MTKSRLSLRNSARRARNSLALFVLGLVVLGCSASTAPTYTRDNIVPSIESICKKEYDLDAKARLVGNTIWVYIPVEDLFVPNDKPEKRTEKFVVPALQYAPHDKTMRFEYSVNPVQPKEKQQDFKYNKPVIDKVNGVWRVLRRIILSIDGAKGNEPRFYCMITADIKTGIEVTEIFYYLDFKKVSYEYISVGEYQHRIIEDTSFGPTIVGDKEGKHLNFRDITMKEFIAWQIIHRIRLKFEKPEVEPGADIDKEIIKIIAETVKIYDFKDFDTAELMNLTVKRLISMDRQTLWSKTKD